MTIKAIRQVGFHIIKGTMQEVHDQLIDFISPEHYNVTLPDGKVIAGDEFLLNYEQYCENYLDKVPPEL